VCGGSDEGDGFETVPPRSQAGEPAPNEILAQHPAPARAQQKGSGAEGQAAPSVAPRQASLQPDALKEPVGGDVWENVHLLHVKVSGAVLGGDHAPDGEDGRMRSRGWSSVPRLPPSSGASFLQRW